MSKPLKEVDPSLKNPKNHLKKNLIALSIHHSNFIKYQSNSPKYNKTSYNQQKQKQKPEEKQEMAKRKKRGGRGGTR